MTDVRAALQNVFRAVFDDPRIVLKDEMSAKDFADWDSLQHINLIVATEKGLGVRFNTADISRLKQPGQTIGAFIQLIEQKLSGR